VPAIEIEIPLAQSVTVTEDTLHVDLSDGRTISVPSPGIHACFMPRPTNAKLGA